MEEKDYKEIIEIIKNFIDLFVCQKNPHNMTNEKHSRDFTVINPWRKKTILKNPKLKFEGTKSFFFLFFYDF